MEKEEHAIILEYLPNGYPLEGKLMPIAQAVGANSLVLLELVPRKGMALEVGEKVYIGQGKRDKIYYILGRLHREKLTEQAKEQLQEHVSGVVKESESKFLEFFNTASAINKRVHQIELLPGMGEKHMHEIIEKREEEAFKSFDDMKKRIANLPDPVKAVEKRIIQELTNMERFNLFTQ